MAGKKTQAQLTPEEKLQQALVPEAEQPYKVPANWCWVKAGNFFNIFRGVSYKKHQIHTKKEINDCLIMRGGNVLEGGIDLESDNVYVDKSLVEDIQLLRKNDVVIVSSTGSTKIIGKAGIVDKDYFDVSFGAFLTLIRPIDDVNKTFVDFYFQSELYRERVRLLANGVNINNIRFEHIAGAGFPLPPLTEQQRIVERIESLFAKLDEAKENLQNVLYGFETRKAAILHKAFTGELTANWRKQHGVSMESWVITTLKDVCLKITDGTHNSPVNTPIGEYMYITAKNIKETGVDLSNITFVSKDVHNEIYSRCDVQYGDVLYIKDGATTGIATVNNIEIPFSLLSSVAVLRPNKKIILAKYMAYNLNSSEVKSMMINNMSGNAITRLTLTKIKAAIIKICSLEEQAEIVRIIDDLLAKELQAKELAENALAKIDLIKKSILARAFRGKLGTNNPADEPAVELLKRML